MSVTLPKYSIGVGDRFAHQAKAQLRACLLAQQAGVEVIPVWNKSNREHRIIGSEPVSTRAAADQAVQALGWTLPYFVDADHVNLETFERFVAPCDFFTLDVADNIGKGCDEKEVASFLHRHTDLLGASGIPGIDEKIDTGHAFAERTARKFLSAVQEAGRIYRAVASIKGEGNFITEISMDETDAPQSPSELLLILAAVADEKVPIQTIAPKFTGRFNKGVDYSGDVNQFAKEFRQDLATIKYAVDRFDLPRNLKLSVHSGSDKFSIYSAMSEAIHEFDAGVHVKTAGTTWLEELIGLAEADGEGLVLAKAIYVEAFARAEELCSPYASVIDIRVHNLPSPETVNGWSSTEFVRALRHDRQEQAYNPDLRQLLHVSFKVAAKLGRRYLDGLETFEGTISRNVTENLFERHIRPIFLAGR